VTKQRTERLILGGAGINLILAVIFIALMVTDQPVSTGWVLVTLMALVVLVMFGSIVAYARRVMTL
jgi:uncharacterized membrane protein